MLTKTNFVLETSKKNEKENRTLAECVTYLPVYRRHSFWGVTYVWIIGHLKPLNEFVPTVCHITALVNPWTQVLSF